MLLWVLLTYQTAFKLLLWVSHHQTSFLIFAALVLEPDADDPRTEASHFHQVLLHEGVRSGIGAVTGLQHVELGLAEHRPHTRGSF